MSADFSRIGLVVFIAAFFIGTTIAIRGGRALSDGQRQALAAGGPDVPGMVVLLAIVACVLFARVYAVYAATAAVILTAVWAYRMLPKFNRKEWSPVARILLVLGNLVLALGALSFVALTAVGLR